MPTEFVSGTHNRVAGGLPPAPMIPVGFVVAPVFLLAQPNNWQAQLYEAAYERARQAAAIPVHYRRFFSVWN